MFSVMFNALKRILDKGLIPALISLMVVAWQWFFDGLTWIMVHIVDFLLVIMSGLISVIPFPDVTLNDGTFGSGFMDIASVAGLWPALGIWLAGTVAAFITRLVTLGVVGK